MVMEIIFKDVSYIYSVGTPFESEALHGVNFTIPDKSFTAIIGHTGSGKSTAIRHFNALLKPSSGEIKVGDTVITPASTNKEVKKIRKKIGMVFQFPEAQLFEETVLKDVMFGPLNFGASEEQAKAKAHGALALVGIPEELYERSPFDLSGGQMRRVAIAGVLAMQPEVLILDEPTAGLDPKGRQELMTIFNKLYASGEVTIILVTHQMNDVADFSNHVVVMANGTCVKEGSPQELFADPDWLRNHQLGLPDTLAFKERLMANGMAFESTEQPLDVDDLADLIVGHYRQEEGTKNEG